VKPSNAIMYHYGWVREPLAMQAKFNNFGSLWHGDQWKKDMEKKNSGAFQYDATLALKKFSGSHPTIMNERVARLNWDFDYEPGKIKLPVKERFKNLVETVTGGKRPFDYKNYREI